MTRRRGYAGRAIVSLIPLVCLVPLIACDNPCKPGGEPEVEIGTGESAFAPLGPRTELVHGPQGGYHLLIALRMRYFDASTFLGADVIGTVDGEPLARTQPWLEATCEREPRALESAGTFLIYDGQPEDLHGLTTTIRVDVQDVSGHRASAEAQTQIWDPLLADAP